MTTGLTTACLATVLTARFHQGVGVLVLCGVAHSTFAYFPAGHITSPTIPGGPFLVPNALVLPALRDPPDSRSSVSSRGGASRTS
jgi:hypothetical protein